MDDTCKVLMRDVSQAIFYRIRQDERVELYPVSNELSEESNLDVEHLITLLDSSPYSRHLQMAEQLRQLFREEILHRLGPFSTQLTPNLYAVLFDLYQVKGFDEQLTGVISLNYAYPVGCQATKS